MSSSSSNTQESRRAFLLAGGGAASTLLLTTFPTTTLATDDESSSILKPKSTSEAVITDKIFIEIKGLASDDPDAPRTTERIVIGLFGNDAPQPISILKQLVSPTGYPSKCKPKEERLLQREQLEANKVYNGCKESEERGVDYDFAQVWRISQNERIDVGSVAGRFVARENPTFMEDKGSSLTHDAAGVVSVRRGNDGGFGFTIYPGGAKPNDDGLRELNEENIVVGKVLEGMDIVAKMNDTPVMKSSKLNYQALSGGTKKAAAPTRACRYGGGSLYCSEFKPLKKLTLTRTGVL